MRDGKLEPVEPTPTWVHALRVEASPRWTPARNEVLRYMTIVADPTLAR